MNFVVILINRGMPARVSHDEISEDEKLHYHPVSQHDLLFFQTGYLSEIY
jgi:hypothetical protein